MAYAGLDIRVNDVAGLRSAIPKHDVWGFDLETWNPGSDPDAWDPRSLILNAAVYAGGIAWTFILDHPLDWDTTDDQYSARVQVLDELISNPKKTVVGHNVQSFDLLWWEVHYGGVKAKYFDTRTQHALLEPELNSLDFLAVRYADVVGVSKNEDQLNRRALNRAEPVLVARYNGADAAISRRVYEPLVKDLERESLSGLSTFMGEVSLVTSAMTIRGAAIDRGWAKEKEAEIQVEIDQLREELDGVLDGVNIDSHKQLSDLLFNQIGLPVITKSRKTGKPSTSKEAFLTLRHRAQLPDSVYWLLDKILEYRQATKLVGTYLSPLVSRHTKTDGRIHTNFNLGKGSLDYYDPTGTVTGRLSSSKPNLQNMPRDNRLRGLIVPTPGMRMFDADYSQLELLVSAWFSGDVRMNRAFENGQDQHLLTMAMNNGMTYEKAERMQNDPKLKGWVKEQRFMAKRTNFGIPYGIGSYGLMVQLWDAGVPATVDMAQGLLDKHARDYVGLHEQIRMWQQEAIETGRVVTPTGRFRRLPDASEDNKRVLRQAVNFPIQSLASDITLVSLLLLHSEFERVGGAWLTLTVHDSVMGEYDPKIWTHEDMECTIRRIMVDETQQYMLDKWGIDPIPLKVDVETDIERWTA